MLGNTYIVFTVFIQWHGENGGGACLEKQTQKYILDPEMIQVFERWPVYPT